MPQKCIHKNKTTKVNLLKAIFLTGLNNENLIKTVQTNKQINTNSCLFRTENHKNLLKEKILDFRRYKSRNCLGKRLKIIFEEYSWTPCPINYLIQQN